MLTFNNLQNWLREILAGKQDLEGLHCRDAEFFSPDLSVLAPLRENPSPFFVCGREDTIENGP